MSPIDALGRPNAILLLGATSDIGLAIVERMRGDGNGTVILAGRDANRQPTPSTTGGVHHRYFDASDTTSHAKFFEEVFADHPGLDTVIIAFGVLHGQDDVAESPELAAEMISVNHAGAASALLNAISHLGDHGGGQIVVLSSIAGLKPRASNLAYGASKAGIDFLVRGLGRSLEDTGVQLLLVRPGFVHTKMTAGLPSRPFSVSPQTVADAVVRGLARRDRVIWVPGILRWVMAAVRLLPASIVDRLDR